MAIGKLGAKIPSLVNKDMNVVQTFFEAMSKEDKETQMSVQEALSLMAISCRQMSANNLAMLETMLGAYIDDPHSQVDTLSTIIPHLLDHFVEYLTRYSMLLLIFLR